MSDTALIRRWFHPTPGHFLGGLLAVEGDYQYDMSLGYIQTPVPSEPAWLRKLLGDDFFSDVVCVFLDDCPDGDAAIEHLGGLTTLQALRLRGRVDTNAGLARRDEMRQLADSWRDRTDVTDADLARLKELWEHQAVWLDVSEVTNAGLARLGGFTRLQQLILSSTKVTDAGLAHLSGLTQLQILGLTGPQFTDAGLKQLEGLTRLKGLVLNGTQVTNEGCAKLERALPNCQILTCARPWP
jgi:hypothetical protein